MAGTKMGGKAAAQTNIRLQGEDFYRRIGQMGGKLGGGKGGFKTMDAKKRSEAGRKGGLISRRKPIIAVTKVPLDDMMENHAQEERSFIKKLRRMFYGR